MRRSPTGIEVALSEAMARVASLYAQVPEQRWPDVNGEQWAALEASVDRACDEGSEEEARRAIEAWERHALRVLQSLVEERVDG